MAYFLDYNAASNINSADVSYDETNEDDAIVLDYLETRVIDGIEIGPNASNGKYSYEGLEFRVYAACLNGGNEYSIDQSRVIASTKINAFFQQPCSEITVQSPTQGWVSNFADNDMFPIHLTDYDLGNIGSLKVEYAKEGGNLLNWQTANLVDINSLNPVPSIGSTVFWNTTNIEDGNYRLRTTITCGSNTNSTQGLRGIVDRKAPRKLGYPSPEDKVLANGGDLIAVTFSEDIAQSTNFDNISLKNLITENEVDFDVAVIDNRVFISPLLNLITLPAAIYEIKYFQLEDLYGNAMLDTVTWTLNVGDVSELFCNENTILYVDQNAPAGSRENGLAWEDAFYSLTEALLEACPGSEIHVAEGTYYPTDYLYEFGSDMLDTIPGDSIYFNWTHSYDIYGGFPSGGANFDDRNASIYPTILSGDTNKDGIRNAGDSHTLMVTRANITGRIEGITFENVYSDAGNGLVRNAGAFLNFSDIDVVNCTFRKNEIITPGADAGAWYNYDGDAHFTNCLFYDNISPDKAGAIYNIRNKDIKVTLTNCTFHDNYAPVGSAIFSFGDSVVVQNCIFNENTGGEELEYLTSFPAYMSVQNSLFDASSLGNFTVNLGSNILSSDPNFIDPNNENFGLQENSMAKDEGENSLYTKPINLDLSYAPRFQSDGVSSTQIIDMGPYEYRPCADITSETVLYVDQSLSAGGNGLDWNTAFVSLSKGLSKAKSCGIDTIRIAKGAYTPEVTGLSDPRKATFDVFSGLQLYGGYPSGGGGIPNGKMNLTVLSGEIGDLTTTADNAYHVVTVKNNVSQSHIEGFMISGGNADVSGDDSGGGILHTSTGYGIQSAPIIKNCVVANNHATFGGGIANIGKTLSIAAPVLTYTDVFDNTADFDGGGIYNEAISSGATDMKMSNSIIYHNSAQRSGGGVDQVGKENSQANSMFKNVTIANNSCGVLPSGNGGGIHSVVVGSGTTKATLHNSIVYANEDQIDGVNQLVQSPTQALFTLLKTNIQGGYGSANVMSNNFDVDPKFVGAHVGNFALDACSPLVDKGDNSLMLLTKDAEGNPRKVGQVDVGAVEYDGISTRGNLPTTMEDIVLNCLKPLHLDLPVDGITYAIYNDSLTVLMGGPEHGSIGGNYIGTSSPIMSDTTLKVIVSRDGSFGIDMEAQSGEILFPHNDLQNFNPDNTFNFKARINLPSTSGTSVLWFKPNNSAIHIEDDELVFSIIGGLEVILPLGITPNTWHDIELNYTPISATEGQFVSKLDGIRIGSEILVKGADTSADPLVIGSLGENLHFDGKIDYLSASTNGQPIIQLDFLSAQGSNEAYDMRLAADGGAAQKGIFSSMDRYEVWLPGQDSYLQLCPDTLVLNVLVQPETKYHFVETHLDDGYKSLRERIAYACPNDTIRFANVLMGDTVKFESEIFLDKDLFIEGLGMNGGTTLDGQEFTRLFNTPVDRSITFKDMQMIRGSHPTTGGAMPISDDCTLWNVRFSDNNAFGNGASISTLPFSNLKIKGDVRLQD